MRTTKIEVCVESVESALIAQKAGADRIELCAALTEGGITPGVGLIKMVKHHVSIDVNVIIRPRRGDFCYSEQEFECMKEDIRIIKKIGVNGFVFGILTPEGEVDKVRCGELIELARPCSTTFHRAFDAAKDPYLSLSHCIDLGFDRILTSGMERKAESGIPLLKELMKIARERIILMPGSGINDTNIRRIVGETGASEVHLSAKERILSVMKRFKKNEIPMNDSNPLSEYELERTSFEILQKVVSQLENHL